jgi:hypothetical protein
MLSLQQRNVSLVEEFKKTTGEGNDEVAKM